MGVRRFAGVVSLLWLACSPAFCAEEPDLKIQFIGMDHPSSFSPLIRVHLVNRAYTAKNLVELVASSRLLVDGKPASRNGAPFTGPLGVPPLGEWDGCLSPNDYAPPMKEGRHR